VAQAAPTTIPTVVIVTTTPGQTTATTAAATATTPTAATPSTAILARTGMFVLPMVALGVVAILFGAGLVRTSPRRWPASWW
jgi:hypothetical protein